VIATGWAGIHYRGLLAYTAGGEKSPLRVVHTGVHRGYVEVTAFDGTSIDGGDKSRWCISAELGLLLRTVKVF
jgi:hypothetical protein